MTCDIIPVACLSFHIYNASESRNCATPGTDLIYQFISVSYSYFISDGNQKNAAWFSDLSGKIQWEWKIWKNVGIWVQKKVELL
jgi:hypothetical protein